MPHDAVNASMRITESIIAMIFLFKVFLLIREF